MERQDLKRAGLRVTAPRLKILELLQEDDRHLSAEEIYQRLMRGGEEVGLATVYRVLTQFEHAGLVARHNFAGGHSVFELNTGGHHDHMVCIETGHVIEFENEEIEKLQRDIARKHGFELVDHSLVLYVRPARKR